MFPRQNIPISVINLWRAQERLIACGGKLIFDGLRGQNLDKSFLELNQSFDMLLKVQFGTFL